MPENTAFLGVFCEKLYFNCNTVAKMILFGVVTPFFRVVTPFFVGNNPKIRKIQKLNVINQVFPLKQQAFLQYDYRDHRIDSQRV